MQLCHPVRQSSDDILIGQDEVVSISNSVATQMQYTFVDFPINLSV